MNTTPCYRIALAAIALLTLTSSRLAAETPTSAKADSPVDLAWVPPNAWGFARVELADAWKLPIVEKLLAEQPTLQEALEGFKQAGFEPKDLERATLVLMPIEGGNALPAELAIFSNFAIIFSFNKDCPREAMLNEILRGEGQEKAYKEKSYYTMEAPVEDLAQALYFVNDRTFMVTFRKTFERMVDGLDGAAGPNPLADQLKLAAEKHHVFAHLNIPEDIANALKQEDFPRPFNAFKTLLDARSATVVADLGYESLIKVSLGYPDEATVNRGMGTFRGVVSLVRSFLLGPMIAELAKSQDTKHLSKFVRQCNEALQFATFEPKGKAFTMTVKLKTDQATVEGVVGEIMKMLQTASERMASANNLKMIMIAMHNYHVNHERFPADAIYDRDGKPLLSWRVAILPYLDQETCTSNLSSMSLGIARTTRSCWTRCRRSMSPRASRSLRVRRTTRFLRARAPCLTARSA